MRRSDASSLCHLCRLVVLSGVEWVWEQKERIQWAFKQASEMLRNHAPLHAELERRMLSGASVGECVECIETF